MAPPNARRPLEADLQVADHRLAGDEELVHEDVPRAHGEPPVAREPAQRGASASGRTAR